MKFYKILISLGIVAVLAGCKNKSTTTKLTTTTTATNTITTGSTVTETKTKENSTSTTTNVITTTGVITTTTGITTEDTHIHTFSDSWSYDETHHWHSATCEHTDEKANYSEHHFDGTYKVSEDGTKRYQECECGYKLESENHVYTNWVVTKEPTINEEGEKYALCDNCSEKETQSIPKVYSTANEVNALIEKIGKLSSIKMLDGYLIEETKAAYNNLSSENKKSITNYSVLENAVTTWENSYSLVYDPLINGYPIIDGHATSLGNDEAYGTILKIEVSKTSDTTQFGFNINSNTYDKDSLLHIYVRTPFIATQNTSQSLWFGDFDRDYLNTLTPNGWTEIVGLGRQLTASGNNATKLTETITLQRYVNGTTEEYSGEYYLASIIAEKRINDEGASLIPLSSETIDLVNTWGGDASTVASYSDEEHGSGVELNITAISGAYEIKINGVDKNKANTFDYVYAYVYLPAPAKLYFSQKEWRNNVMTVGVSPDADNNGEIANNQAQYPAGWNKIIIPVSYLPKTSSMYFEIYTPSALGKWVITDFYGGYNSKYISNAATRSCGLSTLNSGAGKFDGIFSKGKDDVYGSYDEITITDLSKCTWGPTITLSGEVIDSDKKFLRFYVYSPLEFPINMAIYGNDWYTAIFPDGHMFNTCLFPKKWNEIIITTSCYNDRDDAFRKFDFSKMTIFFEDIKSTSNIVLDGLKISSFELLDSYPSDAETKLTYDINENAMYVLGTSNTGNQQMMGFVIVYNKKVIVVDGGKRTEYKQLKDILVSLGGHVDYQIFTHAHNDHYGTYLEMYKDPDITVDTLVYNFPSWDNLEMFLASEEDKATNREFQTAIEAFKGNTITCVKGTTISFDDFTLEFLNNRYEITGDINESSMCFKVTTKNDSFIFLGDLSQNNAPKLLEEYKDNPSKLNAKYLQLAHHGQRGGSKALYEAINPEFVFWCTTVRNYNNWTVNGINTGALKSAETKDWLKELNVTDICPFYRTVKIEL